MISVGWNYPQVGYFSFILTQQNKLVLLTGAQDYTQISTSYCKFDTHDSHSHICPFTQTRVHGRRFLAKRKIVGQLWVRLESLKQTHTYTWLILFSLQRNKSHGSCCLSAKWPFLFCLLHTSCTLSSLTGLFWKRHCLSGEWHWNIFDKKDTKGIKKNRDSQWEI